MAERWARWMDRLLGERCDRCLDRVFPRDRDWHDTFCS